MTDISPSPKVIDAWCIAQDDVIDKESVHSHLLALSDCSFVLSLDGLGLYGDVIPKDEDSLESALLVYTAEARDEMLEAIPGSGIGLHERCDDPKCAGHDSWMIALPYEFGHYLTYGIMEYVQYGCWPYEPRPKAALEAEYKRAVQAWCDAVDEDGDTSSTYAYAMGIQFALQGDTGLGLDWESVIDEIIQENSE